MPPVYTSSHASEEAITTPSHERTSSYKDAGVDIDAGAALVEAIKPFARATRRAGAEAALGGFGALFDLQAAGYRDPILVVTTDGVGTKLKVAIAAERHEEIGIDLVAMCVNDLVVQGAEPLLMLDYFATGRLDVALGTAVIKGIAEGCREAGCALVGGETAEMPGMYQGSDYDLAGFALGAVERGRALPQDGIAAGDAVLGLAASGVHSNGFSLVRRIVEECGLSYRDPAPFAAGSSLGEALLTPTRIYVKSCLSAVRAGKLLALAHITGGGLIENIPRVLPRGPCGRARGRALAASAGVPLAQGECENPGRRARAHLQLRHRHGRDRPPRRGRGGQAPARGARRGRASHRPRGAPPGRWARCRRPQYGRGMARLRVGVLISGRGSNLQALIDAAAAKDFPAEIVLVISNRGDAAGLARAAAAGIATRVIEHGKFAGREAFEAALDEALRGDRVELVCNAGFMRILTAGSSPRGTTG